MKKLIFLTLSICILTIYACKKKDTETAYFNCYINGQYWEPEKQQGLGEYPILAKLLYDGIDFRIDVSKGVQNIFIWVRDSTKIISTQYQLFNTQTYYSRGKYDDNISVNEYSTDSTNFGIIQIKSLDKEKQTVEGTFYFTAYNSTLNKTVNITDGKFKLKYTLN